MKLLIVSASQRIDSQSAKVAKYLAGAASGYQDVSHLELCRYELPFWDGEDHSLDTPDSAWTMIKHKLRRADAFILITPEWGGMATPILKNFLLMCDQQDTGHKPAMLVSVVSGISGAYPIAELRMNALKNNKLVAVPDHLIIRNVNDVLNLDEQPTTRETHLRNRIDYSLHMLHQYAGALGLVRSQHLAEPFPKQQEYGYGM